MTVNNESVIKAEHQKRGLSLYKYTVPASSLKHLKNSSFYNLCHIQIFSNNIQSGGNIQNVIAALMIDIIQECEEESQT